MTDNISAALDYVDNLHWAIVPLHSVINGRCSCGKSGCKNPGKHPLFIKGLLEHGLKDATNDKDFIQRCWQTFPKANIGLPCRQNGMFVLDVDKKSGGLDSLRQLVVQYGEMPNTVTANTGGGGLHYYFRYPEHSHLTDKISFLPGLDIKVKGYVILPPSAHISGKRYEWRSNRDPMDIAVADAPGWLLDLIADTDDFAWKTDIDWCNVLDDLHEGTRNNGLYKYACHLLGHGLLPTEVIKLVEAINAVYCNPPLTENEVNTLLISAIKWRYNI